MGKVLEFKPVKSKGKQEKEQVEDTEEAKKKSLAQLGAELVEKERRKNNENVKRQYKLGRNRGKVKD